MMRRLRKYRLGHALKVLRLSSKQILDSLEKGNKFYQEQTQEDSAQENQPKKQPKPSFSRPTIHGPPRSINEAQPSSRLTAQQHCPTTSDPSHGAVQQDYDRAIGNNAGQYAPAPDAAQQHPIGPPAVPFDPAPTESRGPVSSWPTVIILVQILPIQLLLA
ncbi:hypothetical protein M9H77_19304 [Catharanthus roseus]|uniref:Uncharacterized protein n=1 Tax=Catharanthus roseus TaxID=4058 RepID=A0ACC0B9Y1_CATRO|nr:hypothetical protein M9H77_19304 [Catharanthus roseus]